jgi:hypothetical protein
MVNHQRNNPVNPGVFNNGICYSLHLVDQGLAGISDSFIFS